MLSGCSRSIIQDQHSTSLNSSVNSEVEGRLQKSLNEEKQEYRDLLIHYIALPLTSLRTDLFLVVLSTSGSHSKLRGPSIFDSTIQWIGKLLQQQQHT